MASDSVCVLILSLESYQNSPDIGSGQGGRMIGQGSKQPDLVEDVPAYGKWVGLDDL